MLKGIKKLRKIITVLLTVIAALLLFLNLALNFPVVQTALTHSIAGYYSNKLHAKIHIGRVDFELLKKLVLHDVYIQDQHADTLLYAGELKMDIGQISFKNHQLYISNVDIEQAKIHLITYKNENSLNLQFLINAFASADTTKSTGSKWNVAFGQLTLKNIDFYLLNQHDTGTDNYGINTSNLRVHRLYANINTIRFQGDTIRATIERLSANEESGFLLKNLSCYVSLSPHGMELDALKILTANSDISTDLIFHYNRFSDFNDFTNKVEMKANFHRSKVCMDDIGYFAHGLKAVHTCFTLSGEYDGTVNHLTGHNMDIGWGDFSTLQGDMQLDDITDIDSAIIKVNVTNLITSKKEIELLPAPPFDTQNHIRLPDNMSKLNALRINGSFAGSIKSFKAEGAIITDIGEVSANLTMSQAGVGKESKYSGMLQTQNFNLGDFWDIPGLGSVTTSVAINGKGLSRQNADATLSGVIQSLTYRKYTYQNTKLNGELKKGFFSGMVKVVDPHVLLDFKGKINLASQNSVFQFESHITKANLTALHISQDTGGYAILSGHIKVNATGNTIDNLQGSLTIDSTSYATGKSVYHLNHLVLSSSMGGGGYQKVNLLSDYANGSLSGHFHLSNTLGNLQALMSSYIPKVFPGEKHLKGEKCDYLFLLHFNEDTGLTGLFVPGLKFAQGTEINGRYDESLKSISLSGNSKEIDISAKKIKNWKMDLTGDGTYLVLKSRCDTLCLSDSLYTADFRFRSSIVKDTAHYAISWNNDSANFGDIPGYVAFSNKSGISFRFLHPVISMVDSIWKINDGNLIVYDSSRWQVKSFIISHSAQSFISLQGVAGSNINDKLDINIHNINLGNIKLGSTPLEGEANGTASISSLFQHPFFTSALTFSHIVFNKKYLGDADINSYWDTLTQSIGLSGHFIYHGEPVLSVSGKYIPGSNDNSLSLDAALSGFPSSLFQPYLKDVCSSLDGSLKGQIHITGTPARPRMYGNVTEELKKMKFDYLNVSIHSPGINIKIMPDTFQILRSVVLDERNDTAIYTGLFTHNNFKNLQLDFHLKAKNFLCLNTNESQNSSYFGKGFVTGIMDIHGPVNALHIDANITTDKNTVFNIPLETASELDQASYIQFVSKGKSLHAAPAYKVDLGGIHLDFTVHVTDAAICNLLFTYKGEVLQSRGYGTILFNMDNIGVINMHGNYTVSGGTYNFILQNGIINKKFTLQPGGTISWNGDPYNADINLTTIYSTSASLQPFFPGQPGYSKRFPVNCDLDLSGKLSSPDISFKIELPTADNPTQQVVESYLSNGDELNTQVFMLLIVNSFTQPGQGIGGASGDQFGLATTAEVLSNQLTNMFNNINKNFNLGVDINPGSTVNPAEYKVALSTALFKGKVNVSVDAGTVSGIPTTTQTTSSTNNFVGEAEVTTSISKNGKLKAKAFNKANDNTTDLNTLNAPYTQGVGITYKEGFSTWSDFWHLLFIKEPEPVKADSASVAK